MLTNSLLNGLCLPYFGQGHAGGDQLVDLDEFAPRTTSGWLRDELHVPTNAQVIASIGQICLRKGWDTLADALMELAHQRPEAQLVLIGTRHSQKRETREYEDGIRRRFLAAGIEDRVHWLGERSDIPRILNEVDLLVHSARQEPLGRVLLEACASGVPIVATDVGGTRELAVPDTHAIIVPPLDAEALAAGIDRAIADPAGRASRAAAARRRIETDLSFDGRTRRLEAIYEELMSGVLHA